jgi:tetratricopeptide (TPR) repeat protein
MDFGLAGTLQGLAAEARTGLMGTPAYMAPEQVENGPIGPAADIYALGVVLFEMISGVLPFQGASLLETAQLRLRQEAPPLRSVTPNSPPEWESTVQFCLQRDSRKRPAFASEVAARLSGRYERRRRIRSLAVLLLAVCLLGAGWYWASLPHRPNPAAQLALDSARVKLQNHSPAGFREAIAGFRQAIQLDPEWADPWAEIAYTYASASNTSQTSPAVASVEARAAALEAIRLDRRSPRAFGALGWVQSLDYDEWPHAEANLRRALALNPADGQIHYWLGVHLRKKGKFPDAELEDRQALTLSHQTDPQIWCELAFLYWTAGRTDRLQPFMDELLLAYPNYGLTRFLHARLLKEQGRFDEALAELQFSERLQYSPVTVLAERASVEAYRGNTVEALGDLQRLDRTSRTAPVDGLLIAGVYARLGRPDDAFVWLERAYARHDTTLLSLATSPVLQPLRSDQRFAVLARLLHFRS